MSSVQERIRRLWLEWRPGGGWKRLLALSLLGWLLLNLSIHCFVYGMRAYGSNSNFWQQLATVGSMLSGYAWLRSWARKWIWLPLILPIFMASALIWLKKSSIFTGALLAISGMVKGPLSYIFTLLFNRLLIHYKNYLEIKLNFFNMVYL